ncbi:MAG: efflux RND transporter periplasmic adaptor subunit, partial [Eubacteriales bacterium]|nr:efflux RND transporter periplasmic adaptor subunit [Eubacteriales bacterium]
MAAKSKKKIIILSAVAVLVLAIGCGVWYYLGHNSSEPVYVYPFQYIGMTEYWGDSQESYGPVSTDKIQTVFLSDTQTVTEVCVKEGDAVKKGDLLMTFDTTLSDLALERKRLGVEKLKLQLDEAKKQLREINSMEPMEEVEYEPPEISDPDLGEPLAGSFEISTNKQYDGSSREKALICWISDGVELNNDLFDWVLGYAGKYQQANMPEPEPEPEPEPDPRAYTNPDAEQYHTQVE